MRVSGFPQKTPVTCGETTKKMTFTTPEKWAAGPFFALNGILISSTPHRPYIAGDVTCLGKAALGVLRGQGFQDFGEVHAGRVPGRPPQVFQQGSLHEKHLNIAL